MTSSPLIPGLPPITRGGEGDEWDRELAVNRERPKPLTPGRYPRPAGSPNCAATMAGACCRRLAPRTEVGDDSDEGLPRMNCNAGASECGGTANNAKARGGELDEP